MVKKKTLQQEIVTALKSVGVVTKKDLENYTTKDDMKQFVSEATDALLAGMDEIVKNMVTKDEFHHEVKKINSELSEIKSDIHFMKDDIKNIQSAVLPTRSEFNKLKFDVGVTS